MGLAVRPARAEERGGVLDLLEERWGAPVVVARGEQVGLADLDLLVAEEEGELAGCLGYREDGASLEIVTLDAFDERRGVATALLDAAAELARRDGLWRVFLVTTNDNLPAIALYTTRGFRLVTVHENAVAWSRQVKPAIPERSEGGVVLSDELEFELLIDQEGPPPRRRR